MDIEKIVLQAVSDNFISSYPIELFTIAELAKLTEFAKKNMVKVELHAEHSNAAQGVLVEVYKWPLPWKPDFNNMPVSN